MIVNPPDASYATFDHFPEKLGARMPTPDKLVIYIGVSDPL